MTALQEQLAAMIAELLQVSAKQAELTGDSSRVKSKREARNTVFNGPRSIA